MKQVVDKFRVSPIGIWLMIGVVMIIVQVILGGITRLTGSGLSITEWAPILGIIPPTNQEDWEAAFNEYKKIGQFKHINFDFTLTDFKNIYFWEWLHRFWARLIGFVFLIPFIYFISKKMIDKKFIIPMTVLFLLGILQAAIGWIMVKSGLNENDISVSHIRLSIHFISALILLCFTFWYALRFLIPAEERKHVLQMNRINMIMLLILFFQLLYGGFMAGLKAGNFAPTWPDMNGQWWPEGINAMNGFENLVSNPIAVQMIHRFLAYLLFAGIIYWYIRMRRSNPSGLRKKTAVVPLVLVSFQLILGIATVLNSPEKKELIWWGVSHQFVAMLLLLSLTWMQFLLSPARSHPNSQ